MRGQQDGAHRVHNPGVPGARNHQARIAHGSPILRRDRCGGRRAGRQRGRQPARPSLPAKLGSDPRASRSGSCRQRAAAPPIFPYRTSSVDCHIPGTSSGGGTTVSSASGARAAHTRPRLRAREASGIHSRSVHSLRRQRICGGMVRQPCREANIRARWRGAARRSLTTAECILSIRGSKCAERQGYDHAAKARRRQAWDSNLRIRTACCRHGLRALQSTRAHRVALQIACVPGDPAPTR